MSAPSPHENDRMHELLAERALGTIERGEADELDRMTLASGDDATYDMLVAELDLAFTGDALEPMPADVRARLEDAARGVSNADHAAPPAASIRPPGDEDADRGGPIGAIGVIGWIAAAAAILIAAVGWLPSAAPEGEPTFAELASRPDALRTPLSAGDRVVGELVWSEREQTGYMKFSGLEPNEPSESQYQLWIFDAARDDAFAETGDPLAIEHPVDGGVFDVPAAEGEVVVPIRAKLPVREPVLFAVTEEKPGGVVVSDRSAIAAVGAPDAKG